MSKKTLRNLKQSSKKAILGSSLALVGAALSTSAFAAPMTLQQAFQEVLASNPTIKSSEDQAKSAEKNITIARAGYLPALNINAGAGYAKYKQQNAGTTISTNDANQMGATLSQLVFDGWGTPSRIKFNQDKFKAANSKTEEQIENTALETTEAYENVLKFKALENFAIRNVNNHKKFTAEMYDPRTSELLQRYDGGAEALAKARESQAKAALLSIQGEESNADASFENLVGNTQMPALTRIQIEKIAAALPKTLDDAIASALANNPAIQADNDTLRSTNKAITVAKAAYWPTITAQLSDNVNKNMNGIPGRTTNMQAMLLANLNLFNGFADAATVEQADANKMTAEQNLEITRRDVTKAVTQAWNNLHISKERQKDLNTHLASSNVAAEKYQEQFRNGSKDVLNVLDVVNERYNAQTAAEEGKYQVLTNEFTLLAAMGELKNTLQTLG